MLIVIYFVYLISYMPCTRLRLQEQQAVFSVLLHFPDLFGP